MLDGYLDFIYHDENSEIWRVEKIDTEIDLSLGHRFIRFVVLRCNLYARYLFIPGALRLGMGDPISIVAGFIC